MSRLTVPREQAIAQALTRIQGGETLRDIAPSFGVSHVTLWSLLIGDVPDQYKQAQQDVLLYKIAEADDALACAEDQLNLARAREQAKFARFDAERRLPQLFGQRQQASAVTVNVTVDALSQARQALQGRIIDVPHTTSGSDDSQDTPE